MRYPVSVGNLKLFVTFLLMCLFTLLLYVYLLYCYLPFQIKKYHGNSLLNFSIKSECFCRNNEEFSLVESDGKFKLYSNLKSNSIDLTQNELQNMSCNAYSTFSRGKKQKIIGLSLYGTDMRYYHLSESKTNFSNFFN